MFLSFLFSFFYCGKLLHFYQSLQNMSINLDHPKPSGETTVRDAITEVADMVMENV
uniref:Uncharacterized protein n=1 Tax=Aegilops tauschii subsp. strangulata TaxID=200361 RepID=A0A453JFB0_AEGTS